MRTEPLLAARPPRPGRRADHLRLGSAVQATSAAIHVAVGPTSPGSAERFKWESQRTRLGWRGAPGLAQRFRSRVRRPTSQVAPPWEPPGPPAPCGGGAVRTLVPAAQDP